MAANKGHVKAQFAIGNMYYLGEGLSQDFVQARYWYAKAAKKGHAKAMYNLGVIYGNGNGVDVNFAKALDYFKKSEKKGDAFASYAIGLTYLGGYGVEPDTTKAIRLWQESADKGVVEAEFELGHYYYYGEIDYDKALEWLERAANHGNVDGQYLLAKLYEYRLKNYEQSFYWYLQAANQGYAAAERETGRMYTLGLGVNLDYTEAFNWYTKAAEKGDAYAQNNLGALYGNGNGVKQDGEKALYWINEAVNQGLTDAISSLGTLYHEGIGVKQDFQKAAQLYTEAAQLGDACAQHNLAMCYYEGNGVEQDLDKAEELLGQAAGQGFAYAITNLKELFGVDYAEELQSRQNARKLASINWACKDETSTDGTYNLKAVVASESKIEEVNVYVNGNMMRGLNTVKEDGHTMVIDKTVNLADGQNTIVIEVRNATGVNKENRKVSYIPEKKVASVQERRLALVMGNSEYEDVSMRLQNPVNDAKAFATKLENLDFTVITAYDKSRIKMMEAVDNFIMQAKDYDVALVFYAGHGLEYMGENYLVPVDVCLKSNEELEWKGVQLNTAIMNKLANLQCRIKIAVLDACRNNIGGSWEHSIGKRGFNTKNYPKGVTTAFSTSAGAIAFDGIGGGHSPYMKAWLEVLDEPNLLLEICLKRVIQKCLAATNNQQHPCNEWSCPYDFYFNKKR